MRVDTNAASVQGEINVTPMIDVLLVLLIIFMLLNRDRHTHTALMPKPEASQGQTYPQLVLFLPAHGDYELNRQPIPDAELETQLQAINRGRSQSLLFVQADPTRRYADVIRAIDRAKGAGVQVVALMPNPIESVRD